MTQAASTIELVKEVLWPQYKAERERLVEIDKWYRWDHPHHHTPSTASRELKRLIELSRTPWLKLVVDVVAQTMYADGYKSPDDRADTKAWNRWLGNGFESRQIAIHKAGLAYGYSFATALPGTAPDGSRMAALRGHSPLSMQAVYADPAEDDWPLYAMRVIKQPGGVRLLRVYDDEFVHFLSCEDSGYNVKYIEPRPHGAAVTPVVRYTNQLDLDGRADGEVEPFVSVAARINKTDYDRMLTQHFSSWKVRYAAGMSAPESDEERNAEKSKLRQEDFLIAEDPDTKFGTLDATPLDGFINAHNTDIETLAAVSQTPTPALTGKLINLSAEALASVRAQLEQKAAERKVSFGRSHAQLLRLGARIDGDETAANDIAARITWQDTSIRSFSQAVDALGKAAQMLNIPVQSLWPMIPGVTKLDVADWKAQALTVDPIQALHDMLDRQAAAGAPPNGNVA